MVGSQSTRRFTTKPPNMMLNLGLYDVVYDVNCPGEDYVPAKVAPNVWVRWLGDMTDELGVSNAALPHFIINDPLGLIPIRYDETLGITYFKHSVVLANP